MDYTFTGSGVVSIHGCPEVEINYLYTYKYAVSSKVYDKISARKGTLESVIIAKAWFTCNKYGKMITLYKDTDNWLHNEYDLCSHQEAIDITTAYYQKKQDSIDAVLEALNC